MAKKMINISQSKFSRLHAKLKAFEKKNGAIKIGNKSLTNFLLSSSEFSFGENEPKHIRTKRIILQIAGDYSTSPNDLKGTIKLKSNLKYGTDEYALLQTRLDKLVKQYKPSATISSTEANNCEKVSDCTKLVNDKTSDPVHA